MEDAGRDWTWRAKECTKFITVPCPYIKLSMTLSPMRNKEMKQDWEGKFCVTTEDTSKRTPREMKLEPLSGSHTECGSFT